MEKLTLESILGGTGDTELHQYRILQALKERRERFSSNRLYPWLAELIQLAEDLRSLLQQHDGLAQRLPQTMTGVDMENMHIVYDSAGSESPDLARFMAIAAWALPRVEAAVEEGIGIYEFVEQHVSIDHVGILPAYREEGYWFVPDLKAALVHLLRYELSIFSAPNERYRSLKTRDLESLEEGSVIRSPESLKLDLIRRYKDLPNPATYRCDVDIDFPFAETLLPVAKRKFLAVLSS